MKIAIKERHIRAGKKCNGCNCPLALAIREKYDLGIADVTVCDEEVVIHWPKEVVFYVTDPAANKFINDFDHDRPVKPVEVKLTKEGEWMGLRDIDYD